MFLKIQNNFRLLFETVNINDAKSLASACVVLFLVAFFQEGKPPSNLGQVTNFRYKSHYIDAFQAPSEDTPKAIFKQDLYSTHL